MPHRATQGSMVGQEAEGVMGRAQSLCCGFHGKERVRQSQQVSRLRGWVVGRILAGSGP